MNTLPSKYDCKHYVASGGHCSCDSFLKGSGRSQKLGLIYATGCILDKKKPCSNFTPKK